MIVREVRYAPLLCRLGWHRWRCELKTTDPELLRALAEVLSRDCAWGPVHVHACRRCGRVKLEGRTL